MCILCAPRWITRILPYVGSCEMAGGRCSAVLGMQGRWFLGDSGHDSEGFSQQAMTGVAVAHMFLPVHAHVCSTEASCSSMGPRWLIYPILSYPVCTGHFLPPLPTFSPLPTALPSGFHSYLFFLSSHCLFNLTNRFSALFSRRYPSGIGIGILFQLIATLQHATSS